MDHVAIDLGGRESQVCIRAQDGRILEERRVATRALRDVLKRPPSRVILETCAEAFAVADIAKNLGHEVTVVPASMVRTLGVGARKTKTDKRDAQVLSEVSCRIELPSVHVPSSWSRETKSMCGMRDVLVQNRTSLINSVRSELRSRTWRVATKGPKTFPARVRDFFAARNTPVPAHVERSLRSIEQATEAITEADREIAARVKENAVCRRMRTAVGPITALRFVAAIDDVSRFSSAHAVGSYLGLAPGEDSSSDRKRITSITKAGSSAVRWTLVQACWTIWRTRPDDPISRWADSIVSRRGRKQIAVVAMARKMAGILYAMWRDGTDYDPTRAAQPLPARTTLVQPPESTTRMTLERAKTIAMDTDT